jgi:hypothetical protein
MTEQRSEGPSAQEAYATLYLRFLDNQAWLSDRLENMSLPDFIGFTVYVFDQLELAGKSNEVAEFKRVKGLILAMARKELEMARFQAGLSEQQRRIALRTATAYFELAKGFYTAEARPAIDAAWAATIEKGETFGWPSAVFDILEPRYVFRKVPE